MRLILDKIVQDNLTVRKAKRRKVGRIRIEGEKASMGINKN